MARKALQLVQVRAGGEGAIPKRLDEERQRDALIGKSRSKAAKANAMDRKARGIELGFKKCQR